MGFAALCPGVGGSLRNSPSQLRRKPTSSARGAETVELCRLLHGLRIAYRLF